MGLVENEDYEDKKILITEAAWNPNRNRLEMAKCCFEEIGFDAL